MLEITSLRNEIDEIDVQIMSLLEKRFSLATKIGDIKKMTNSSVLDSNREKYILDKINKYSHFPQIERVYLTILSESKSIQRK